jgi:uncharacterized protein
VVPSPRKSARADAGARKLLPVIVEGTFAVDASREETWTVLSDPRSLAALLPGCETVEPGEEGAYRLTAQARVGPFKAKLSGTMSILEARPPEMMRVRVEGQDGVTASRVRAAMEFTLTSEGERRTTVAYSADILISGRLATVGHGIVRVTVGSLLKEFVGRLDARLRREPIAESGSVDGRGSDSETRTEPPS